MSSVPSVCEVKEIVKVLVTQSCSTLSDHMDHSPPGSSVHGILQEESDMTERESAECAVGMRVGPL